MKKLYSIIPKYAVMPIVFLLAANTLTYYVSRLINGPLVHHDVACFIDGFIPFVPAFIVIYVLAYAQWGLTVIGMARYEKSAFFRFMSAYIIGEFIILVIFIAYPTETTLPEITGTDIFSKFTGFIYSCDRPDNLFPSLHCFESWLCFRALFLVKDRNKVLTAFSGVFAVLVFASVVLVKQHAVIDIAGGVAVAEVSILIARLCRAERVFELFEGKFEKGSKSAGKGTE